MCKNQPPPRSTGRGRLFNPRFLGLTVTITLSHGLMIGSSGSHSSLTSSPPTSHPSATSRLEHRVSVFPFSQSLLSLTGCLLPYCASIQSCFKLCFFVNCHESSSFFWPFGPCLAASVVAHWGGNQTFPWPLLWDSWSSLIFALPDQPPPPDHRENYLIWVASIPVIPLAWSRMSLERLEGTRKFLTTLVTLSLHLWS